MKIKPTRKGSSPALLKGQLWKLKDAYIKIEDVGKLLTNYKILKQLDQKAVRNQMSGIATMQSYLKTSKAQLMSVG